MTRLYLVRHGEATGDGTDPGLSPLGVVHVLDAERRGGVRHHVLLSIVGVDQVEGNAHYAGKREQERLVEDGPVPWTILRATQFFGFAGMLARRIARDGVATIPPLLVQPVDVTEVADLLAGTAVGMPQGWRTSNSDPTSPWQFFGRGRGHALTADRMSRSLGHVGDAVPVVRGEVGQSGAQRREVAACS